MIRHPPRSTLFPYPPLSRSRSEAERRLAKDHRRRGNLRRHRRWRGAAVETGKRAAARTAIFSVLRPAGRDDPRSEEHTSELQSQSKIVCRPLLLKKKKNTNS